MWRYLKIKWLDCEISHLKIRINQLKIDSKRIDTITHQYKPYTKETLSLSGNKVILKLLRARNRKGLKINQLLTKEIEQLKSSTKLLEKANGYQNAKD